MKSWLRCQWDRTDWGGLALFAVLMLLMGLWFRLSLDIMYL